MNNNDIKNDGHLGNEETDAPRTEMIYKIADQPPWCTCIMLGLQHFLTLFGGIVAIPFMVSQAICIGDDHLATSKILGTLLFASGIATFLQTTIGSRLPIVQGGAFVFMVPIFGMMATDKWKCPSVPANYTINGSSSYFGSIEHHQVWTSRMCEIQGALIIASLFQIVLGGTGLVGLCLRFITPLSIAPFITLVGVSLFPVMSLHCSAHWWIALMTMVLVITCSQYLRNITVPVCSLEKRCSGLACNRRIPLFMQFSVILGISVSWMICAMLTVTDVFPNEPDAWGYKARTDIKIHVLYQSNWFNFPYPGQWGMPTFGVASIMGMVAGTLASIVESIGDYYACARLSEAPPPPVHAVNRGIMMEGFGSLLAACLGTGPGLTSYADNIGVISVTKVASRRVVQAASILTVLLALSGKLAAFFVSMPEPVFGGIFMIILGMIVSAGVSNLQLVEMNSSRNLFVFGFSLMFGLTVPTWVRSNPKSINTGHDVVDQVILVLLSTNMLVGFLVGLILDNTVPGTLKERGVIQWRSMLTTNMNDEDEGSLYEFPAFMNWIRDKGVFRYIPVCPTYSLKVSHEPTSTGEDLR